MLIFSRADLVRLFPNFLRELRNSRSFHVLPSYNGAFFSSFFLLQASNSNSKEITFKWSIIHFSEFKTTPTFSIYSSDSSSWEVLTNPTSPRGAKRKRIQSSTSTRHKNAVEYEICSVTDEYGRADCACSAYNSKCWFPLWKCEFLCQIYLFLNWKQFSIGNGQDVVTCGNQVPTYRICQRTVDFFLRRTW